MFGHNIGFISSSNLLVPRVFNVPNLSYNLFSMGKLAELGYCITFDYSWCIVQDSTTGQELRTDHRVRHKLEMEMLYDLSSVIYRK